MTTLPGRDRLPEVAESARHSVERSSVPHDVVDLTHWRPQYAVPQRVRIWEAEHPGHHLRGTTIRGYYAIVQEDKDAHYAAHLDTWGRIVPEKPVSPYSAGYALCVCGMKVYARTALKAKIIIVKGQEVRLKAEKQTLEEAMAAHAGAPHITVKRPRVMLLEQEGPQYEGVSFFTTHSVLKK